MKRFKFKRTAAVTLSILALTAVNTGFIKDIPFIQETVSFADGELITDMFPDKGLRNCLEDNLGGEDRPGVTADMKKRRKTMVYRIRFLTRIFLQ